MRKNILYSASGRLTNYQVIDMRYNGRPARVLFAGRGATPQSGIAHDDNPELLFEYNQRFMEIAESLKPKSIVVIGGGTFTLPSALHKRFRKANIDAVEVEEQLVEIAREYFDLPSNPRLQPIVSDGRDYIDNTSKKYDLIVVDAFVEYDIPRSLLSIEAARRYHDRLTRGGVVAVNFIARYHTTKTTMAHQLVKTFNSVFARVDLYQSDMEVDKRADQNLLLVASKRTSVDFAYLQSEPVQPKPSLQPISILRDEAE